MEGITSGHGVSRGPARRCGFETIVAVVLTSAELAVAVVNPRSWTPL